jgi:hypothetical protein
LLTLADIRAPTQAKVLVSWAVEEPSHIIAAARSRVELVVILAWGELIRAVYSDDPRRRERAAEKILSSYAACNHPLAPARR